MYLSDVTVTETKTLCAKHAGHVCQYANGYVPYSNTYQGADKSLARPTPRCILFDGENISFDASLVMYINSTNIPPIMIINRVVSFLVGLRTYQHPCTYFRALSLWLSVTLAHMHFVCVICFTTHSGIFYFSVHYPGSSPLLLQQLSLSKSWEIYLVRATPVLVLTAARCQGFSPFYLVCIRGL